MPQNTEKTKEVKKIYDQIGILISQSEEFGKTKDAICEIERDILSGLLEMGASLLKIAISTRTKEIESQGPPEAKNAIVDKGMTGRKYQSIFGEIEIPHRKYHIAGQGSYYPLDSSMNLPKTKLSYVLQDWIVGSSADLDFRESVSSVNEILGLKVNATQSKAHCNSLAKQVDNYYKQSSLPRVTKGDYICLEWDGKGVPIIKKDREESTDKLSPTSVVGRLKRGQKRGIKKTATVSVVSTFTPKQRNKDSIIRGLFKTPLTSLEEEDKSLQVVHNKKNNWHKDIHRRAFLGSQDKSINYGVQWAKRLCNGEHTPCFVVLVDGGVGLEDTIKAVFDKEELSKYLTHIILDIVHVSEYVWKAGNAILGEKSKLRTQWVRSILSDILDGKIEQVIQELQKNRDKTNLSKSAKELLDKTITYFTNHQHKMDYKTYLEKGLPVSTALVESSCGHLVKDRMERSGMRWSLQGAQNMMDIRAVKKNGDWAQFMEYVKSQNQAQYEQKRA